MEEEQKYALLRFMGESPLMTDTPTIFQNGLAVAAYFLDTPKTYITEIYTFPQWQRVNKAELKTS
jgi:hypothetical protein